MNLADEIKKVHKAIRKLRGAGAIVAPLSAGAKEWLTEEGYKIGEAVTPCGCGGHNTVSH